MPFWMLGLMTLGAQTLKVTVSQCQLRHVLQMLDVMDHCCPGKLCRLLPVTTALAFAVISCEDLSALTLPLLRVIESLPPSVG